MCRAQTHEKPLMGVEQTSVYLPLLGTQNIALVTNQTGVFTNSSSQTHMVDSLVSLGVNLKKIFAPEHGFRGDRANGAHIHDDIDLLHFCMIYYILRSDKHKDNVFRTLLSPLLEYLSLFC